MSDDWDFYFSSFDDKPVFLFVDLGIASDTPMPAMREIAWLRIKLLQPDEAGMVISEEHETLGQIEEALLVGLEGLNLPLAYVGRITMDGCRDFFVYAADGKAVERQLLQTMRNYPAYAIETEARLEPNWDSYFKFLYPTPRDMQSIQNMRVLRQLQESGDQEEIEREVCHWIMFDSAAVREKYAQARVADGFEVKDMSEREDSTTPYTLLLSHISSADFPSINEASLHLYDHAQDCGADYDGWETSVERTEGI